MNSNITVQYITVYYNTIHDDIKREVADFFKAMITFFANDDLEWIKFLDGKTWADALNKTLDKVRDIIRTDPLVVDLSLTEFHPSKVVDVLDHKINKYCKSLKSIVACTATEIKTQKLKLCGNDKVGLKLAARNLVSNSFLEFGKVEARDQVSLNIAITNLEARMR